MSRWLAGLLLVGACQANVPVPAIDCDTLPLSQPVRAVDRKLIGAASSYPAEAGLSEEALACSEQERRALGWRVAGRVLEAVPIAEAALPVSTPRWRTWYGKDDVTRVWKKLYADLGPDGRKTGAAIARSAVADAFAWNAQAVTELSDWPPERYQEYLERFQGPIDVQGAAGAGRVYYSPDMVADLLTRYTRLDPVGALSPPAAVVKAQWQRAEFGLGVPVYDTSPNRMVDHGRIGEWQPEPGEADPDATLIYTARLPNGDRYRLSGLHIMTRELDHWAWVSLWWSPDPDSDFGADRPPGIPAPFQHYKMCIVTGFVDGQTDAATWCSNPYLETGAGNVNTNCLGCHQHAGTDVHPQEILAGGEHFPDSGRAQVRDQFPGDYLWSLNDGDRLARIITDEIRYYQSFER